VSDWRVPIIPVAVDHDTEFYDVVNEAGIPTVRKSLKYVLKPDDVQRLLEHLRLHDVSTDI